MSNSNTAWGDGDVLLDIDAIADLIGAHPQTIRKWVRKGSFPPPIHITPNVARWRQSEVRKWRDDLTAEAR